jgi:hypothetical protein
MLSASFLKDGESLVVINPMRQPDKQHLLISSDRDTADETSLQTVEDGCQRTSAMTTANAEPVARVICGKICSCNNIVT